MKTNIQLVIKKRKSKLGFSRHPGLVRRPQLSGIIFKVTKITPRKPCSALRAVCKIKIRVTKKTLWCFLPGDDKSQAGKIATQHKVVLIHGGGPKDLPGVHYKLIRGWPSNTSVASKILESPRLRVSRRSKYGIKDKVRIKRVRLLNYRKRLNKQFN